MGALTKLEPMPPVDRRRPTRMPSLPEWVESRLDGMRNEQMRDETTGRWREVPTVAPGTMLSQRERLAVQTYRDDLDAQMLLTPERNEDCERATMVIVTKMLLVLPSQKVNDVGAEARAEAYMDALDDVPSWAVEAAVRGWYRREYGERIYTFAPAPPDLREIAVIEQRKVGARAAVLSRLLQARERPEPQEHELRRMRERVDALMAVAVRKP